MYILDIILYTRIYKKNNNNKIDSYILIKYVTTLIQINYT